MKSSVIKRSVTIDGHKTSISLEDAFWSDLKKFAQAQRITISELVAEIDRTRKQGNLSSASRLFVLGHFVNRDRRTEVADTYRAAVDGESAQLIQP